MPITVKVEKQTVELELKISVTREQLLPCYALLLIIVKWVVIFVDIQVSLYKTTVIIIVEH